MKCNELKPLVFSLKDLAYIDEQAVQKNFENPHDNAVYKATEVDAAIAELKAENEELKKKCEAEKSIGATFSKNGADLARWVEELRKEIESLKASHYAEMVDAGMRERRLKRALYKACSNWMIDRQLTMKCFHLEARARKFDKAIAKCQEKAEEYK